MKRIVIHIEGQRTQRMLKEMSSQYGTDFEIFPAIIKKVGSEGISESFKEVIRQNYNEEFIHILEDDVKFVHKDAALIFDNSFKYMMPIDGQILLGGSYSFNQVEDLGRLLKVDQYRSFHSIIVKKSAYDAFLSHDIKEFSNIDNHVSNVINYAYVCNPQIAIQYNGFSYNRGQKVNYDHFLSNKNIYNESKSIL